MSYKTIIARENFGQNGDCWVARDKSGTWRTFCAARFAGKSTDAVVAMYHADEIRKVIDNGDGTATAIIEEE